MTTLTRSLAAAATVLVVAAAGLVAVGVAFGQPWLLVPRLPPRSGMDRFLLLAWPAACAVEVAVAEASRRNSGRSMSLAACAARIAAAVGLGWLLLSGSVHLQGEGSRLLLVSWAVALGAAWHLLAASGERPVAAISVVVAILVSGGLILVGGWIRGGLLAVPLAVAAGSVAAFAREPPLRKMVVGCAAAGLVGLVTLGHFFGRLSVLQAAVVLAAAVGAAVLAARLGADRGRQL